MKRAPLSLRETPEGGMLSTVYCALSIDTLTTDADGFTVISAAYNNTLRVQGAFANPEATMYEYMMSVLEEDRIAIPEVGT